MSAPIIDGGRAFPGQHQTGEVAFNNDTMKNEFVIASHEGMSLRDYLAAHALPAVIERTWFDFDYEPKPGLNVIENHAVLAYEIADAMLKARAS